MKYYVASKVKHAPMWRRLRSGGIPIISSWIDEAGEGETANYGELSTRCIVEIRSADVLVLFVDCHEILKGALIEAGIALAFGKTVRCFGDDIGVNLSRVFVEHPLWSKAPDIETAFYEFSDKAQAAPLTKP